MMNKRKTYIILSNTNSVNWDITSRVIRQHPYIFASGNKDFGCGVEPYVECPGCKRNLPIVVCELDHILSKHRYSRSFLDMDSSKFQLINGQDCKPFADNQNATATAKGGYVIIKTGSIYNPVVKQVQADEIWKNDLRNLQYLCSSCNKSKQDKDWVEWGKNEKDALPFSEYWKHYHYYSTTNDMED